MSKLTMSQAVAVIPVSESTLRRDLKSGKVSYDTDAKGRKQIDVSELTRVYGVLKPERAEPVNDTTEKPSMNGTETPTLPNRTENDNENVIALLQGQVQDLKAQLADEKAEKQQLLALANNLQKQNEVLMLPQAMDAQVRHPAASIASPREKHRWGERLKRVFTRTGKVTPDAK